MNLNSETQKVVVNLSKDGWDILELIGKFAMTIAIFSLGLAVQTADSRGSVEAEYVKLAIGLLANEPTDNDEELRLWAVEVLDAYSEVEISAGLIEKIADEPLPIDEVKLIIGENIRQSFSIMGNEDVPSEEDNSPTTENP